MLIDELIINYQMTEKCNGIAMQNGKFTIVRKFTPT
jgi:hypothetical protein